MRRILITRFLWALTLLLALPQAGRAQGYSLDARRIGMGGTGNSNNLAEETLEGRSYSVIPIPLGLFQVYDNRRFFDPDDPEFDPVRAIEYAANPLHYTLDRNANSAGNRFVHDLVEAELNRDLNTYRGFIPSQQIKTAGLMAPSWGKGFRISGSETSARAHSAFIGVGPYLSMSTAADFDQNLIDIFASSTNVYRPNSSFVVGDVTTAQGAVAVTGGYRGRYAVAGLSGIQIGTNRPMGVHVAANYSYLHGIHYESGDLAVRFDTDAAGLVTLLPTTTPVVVDRATSKSGRGFAIDIGTVLVMERWDIGFGVDGVANRINWKDLSSRQYVLQSLFLGGDFQTLQGAPIPSPQAVKLPVRYSGSGSYHADRWSASAEVGRDLAEEFKFNAGGEFLVGRLALRGGTRYSRQIWHGATGVGFNITGGFGIDVAAFHNSANIEERRRPSFALSLRFNRDNQ